MVVPARTNRIPQPMRSYFQELQPCRVFVFQYLNLTPYSYLCADHLRVSVIDRPTEITDATSTAVGAMLVPIDRQDDWIFSTEEGNLQLLLEHPEFARLVLLGTIPSSSNPTTITFGPHISPREMTALEISFTPLMVDLCHDLSFQEDAMPRLTFVRFKKDLDVVGRVIRNRSGVLIGERVGDMCVEEVEIREINAECSELRRRLIFKKTPTIIQTQMRLYVTQGRLETLTTELVQPNLIPMVTSLGKIAPYLDGKVECGYRPRVCVLGVGGGALVSFLVKLNCSVVGVELDKEVVSVARKYFGLKENKYTRLIIGDGIEFPKEFSRKLMYPYLEISNAFMELDGEELMQVRNLNHRFDVVMCDMVSLNGRTELIAPPSGFLKRPVIKAIKYLLNPGGILVLNVLTQQRSFYHLVVSRLQEVFKEVYECQVEGDTNMILLATTAPIQQFNHQGLESILAKLKAFISEEQYLDAFHRVH